MSFIETIKIENGKPLLLARHQARMRHTAATCHMPEVVLPDLTRLLPDTCRSGVVKCRIVYGEKIDSISFTPYQQRVLSSLKLVDGGSIDYSLKSADRRALEALLAQRGACDEVLIVRDGWITDTSYSNVVLQRGQRFFTPERCLLNGVQRQELLSTGRVMACPIAVDDLPHYETLFLINAMMSLEEHCALPIGQIDTSFR